MQIRIVIDKLRVKASVGVRDWERICKRVFLINAEIMIDADVDSDKLRDTLDYDFLCTEITEVANNTNCHLVEKFAHSILQSIIKHEKVLYCKLKVIKKFVILNLSSVSVTMEFQRKNV